MSTLLIPQFVSVNANQILADQVAFYNSTLNSYGVNKTLQPGQPEQLILNDFAYREALVLNAINSAALQNLVSFAVAPVLDYLGLDAGVERLIAQPSVCSVEFTLISTHGTVTIPMGTRIASSDGNFVFATTKPATAISTDTTIIVPCECTQGGTLSNGYPGGSIIAIQDPLSFVASVANLNATTGGTDDETDDRLRQRILLAPGAFSTCGTTDGYKFFALSADPTIISVTVNSPTPGQVNIYPLVNNAATINTTQTSGFLVPNSQYIITTYNAGDDFTNVGAASNAAGVVFVATGTTPAVWSNTSVLTLNNYAALCAKVYNYCSPTNRRPLCDTVFVLQPNQINYRITANLTLYNQVNAVAVNQTLVTQQVIEALNLFTSSGSIIMGNDIVYNQIEGKCTNVVGVYDAGLILEQFISGTWVSITGNILLTDIDFGYCTSVTVNVIGFTNG